MRGARCVGGGASCQIVVQQDAQRGAIHVVILFRPQRPEEAGQTSQTQGERQRNEVDEDVHDRFPTERRGAGASECRDRARSALSVTSNDEPDIAAAAINGVTKPAIAIGTANVL